MGGALNFGVKRFPTRPVGRPFLRGGLGGQCIGIYTSLYQVNQKGV